MSTRVLLDRVQRAVDRINALGLDDLGDNDVLNEAVVDALHEIRDDLKDVLVLPTSFEQRNPDWTDEDPRQCGKVAHLI